MTDRQCFRSGAPWEPIVAYSRAVRSGNFIAVSGTAPIGEGGAVVGEGDPYLQARRCIEIIAAALREAGSGLQDVVWTRMFVTDIEQWPEFARAHQEAFADINPATSMVEVSRLVAPEMLIEIEADAIVSS